MKLTYAYSTMVILLIVVVYTWAQHDATTPHEYCIIQGDNVIMRSQPALKAKAVGRLDKYEFVYCIGKTEEKTRIDADEDYWYKIRNCDNKQGWVFGKFIHNINSNFEYNKYYKEIIKNEIINHMRCNYKNKVKVFELKNLDDHYIMDFESMEKLQYAKYGVMGARWIVFYKIIEGKLVKTIHQMSYDYINYKHYVLFYNSKGFDIYNTKKFRDEKEELCIDIPCKYYAHTGFYLRKDVISNLPECNTDWNTRLNCISYSDMEFNPETMEVIVNVRKEEGKLLKQEKYKFSDGKFVKIE